MPVFPIDARGNALGVHGHGHASNVPAVVEAWWKKHPDAWPALSLSEVGGFCALLIESGARGVMAELSRTLGRIESPTVLGANGYEAVILRRGRTPLLAGEVVPGITLCTEHWCPLPPMGDYVWLDRPTDMPVAHLRGAWLDTLRDKSAPVVTLPSDAEKWAAAAMAAELEGLQGVGAGQHNEALNRAAFCLGQIVGGGHLSEVDVMRELVGAAKAWGWGEREARSCVRCGLRAGMKNPRQPPRRVA